MSKGYHILTVTHRNTQLNALGQFAVQCKEGGLSNRLSEIKEEFNISELMYLATCNRIMYFIYTSETIDFDYTRNFFKAINPGLTDESLLADKVAHFHENEAINHLFEVAASIDSLVVGERQILRQLREAYTQNLNWKLTGDHIRLAMKFTIEAAKEVYAQTRIGEKPISIVSLAIQKLIKTNLPKDARILLIGAGQTNTLATKFLVKHEYSNVVVFNRSIDKAQRLASMLKGAAYPISELAHYKEGFDCMIICTASTEPLINSQSYPKLVSDDNREKILIDLAIPNNIHKDVVENFNVQYIEIDDLRNLAKENLSFREKEVIKGRELLIQQIENFSQQFKQRQIEKAMRVVPQEIKAIKAHAMNKVFKKDLENLDEASYELIVRMMNYMEKQCIGIPMKAAKNTVL